MDVQKKLDEIAATVAGARSMPMSASCVVNRADLLAMLEEVSAALPTSLSQAQELLGDREQMVQDARAEAQRIIESAHAERGSLVSETQVARQSQDEAERILAEARREADEIRAEADDYVDSKLANFEVVLTKTIGSVDRGREKLLGRTHDGAQGFPGDGFQDGPDGPDGSEDPDAPERSADPETLRRRADAYVDAKLGAFEAVLSKTLEAVGRGRLKLSGHSAIDDLGAHLAAADAEGGAGAPEAHRQSDAEYLAHLAAPAAPEQADLAAYGYDPQTGAAVPEPAGATAGYDYGRQDGYGYGQDGYPQGDYGQAAAAAAQNGYADPYATAPGYQDASGYDYTGQGDYGQQPGYPQQGYEQGYAADPAAGQPPPVPQIPYQQGPDQAQQGQGGQPQGYGARPAAALDETSFFDTGMIDLNRLRELEQGR